MIKFKQKSRWTPAPPGTHDAVTVDVVANQADSGHRAESIRVVWEVDKTLADGRRFTVTKIYLNADAFTRDFGSVLPTGHPFITGQTEDVESIIGTPCRVLLVHNRKKDGEIFPHVEKVFPPAKATQIVCSELYVRLKDRQATPKEQPSGQTKVIAPDFRLPDEERRTA